MELRNKTESQPEFIEEIIAEKPETIDKTLNEVVQIEPSQNDSAKPRTKRIRIAIAKRK